MKTGVIGLGNMGSAMDSEGNRFSPLRRQKPGQKNSHNHGTSTEETVEA